MAVMARDSVTLALVREVAYMRRYYLLQASNLAAPDAPVVNPAVHPWTETEPTYTAGSTNSLYVVDLVVFNDGDFDYLPVQLSSSYEAAKVAYNLAEAAQGVGAQALASANGKNAVIISLNAATGTTNPNTGLDLVVGDSWIRWNNITDREIQGSWYWNGDAWEPQVLGDAMLASIDVNKLMVLGEARMTEAVVSKIIGDAAYFNKLTVEDLVSTGTSTINALVVQRLAARMLETESIRTMLDIDTGLYAVMDSFGFRVIDNGDVSGTPSTLIKLGPDGDQLLQLGAGSSMTTIDSGGGVAAKTVTANQIYLDGRPISQALDTGLGSVLAWKQLFGAYSRELVGRDYVLYFRVFVPGGRVYRLRTTSAIVRTQSGSVNPMIQLHYTTDGVGLVGVGHADWGGTCVGESTVGPFAGFRSLPPIERHLDFRDRSGTVEVRAAASIGDLNNAGWCRVDAPVHPFQMYLEDVGANLPELGIAYTLDGGSGGEASPTRYTKTYAATGWATYFRNGARDTAAVGPIQGRAGGSSVHRSCFFTFPSMTADLFGATIHRITLRSRADHWWYGSGGTGAWCWHGDTGIPPTSPVLNFMRNEPGWPRGATREAEIIPEEFAAWQSGARRGFGFDTASTSEVFYGRFSTNLAEHTITVEYSK